MLKTGDKVIVECEAFTKHRYNMYGTIKSIYGKHKQLYSVEVHDGNKFIKWSPIYRKSLKLDVQYYRDQKIEEILNSDIRLFTK